MVRRSTIRDTTTTVTTKGQVTIPASIREMLGIRPHDKVKFHVDDGQVRVVRVPTSVRDVYGSIKPVKPGADIDEQIRLAKEERAERYGKRVKAGEL